MKVYLLISDWMHNGDNTVNEVSGVFDCLKKAQKAMAEDIEEWLMEHDDSYNSNCTYQVVTKASLFGTQINLNNTNSN